MPENLIGSDEWAKRFAFLFKKYDGRKHPLEHLNTYQLMVMVILSAQDSDRHINEISPAFFKVYPTLKKLSGASPEDLGKFIGKVRNFANKSKWLITLAQTLKDDKNIPMNLKDLVALPGIGRKSANVIISESGGDMEGVIVDLHV
ncbi:MAG: endonuclease III, partial [Leptospira sp.]|nr:endonuclease III [Leptospira sp.]